MGVGRSSTLIFFQYFVIELIQTRRAWSRSDFDATHLNDCSSRCDKSKRFDELASGAFEDLFKLLNIRFVKGTQNQRAKHRRKSFS